MHDDYEQQLEDDGPTYDGPPHGMFEQDEDLLRCDICGDECDDLMPVTVSIEGTRSTDDIEVCPDCYEKLIKANQP